MSKYLNVLSVKLLIVHTPTARAKALAHYLANREVYLGSRTAAYLRNTA